MPTLKPLSSSQRPMAATAPSGVVHIRVSGHQDDVQLASTRFFAGHGQELVGIHSYSGVLTQRTPSLETTVKRSIKKKLKEMAMKLLEKAANRIHPTNNSGNNVSKM